MDRYAYYVCFKCSKAYYGGEARCDAEMGEKYNPQELVCGGCSDVARAKVGPRTMSKSNTSFVSDRKSILNIDLNNFFIFSDVSKTWHGFP